MSQQINNPDIPLRRIMYRRILVFLFPVIAILLYVSGYGIDNTYNVSQQPDGYYTAAAAYCRNAIIGSLSTKGGHQKNTRFAFRVKGREVFPALHTNNFEPIPEKIFYPHQGHHFLEVCTPIVSACLLQHCLRGPPHSC